MSFQKIFLFKSQQNAKYSKSMPKPPKGFG
jgi:hypothetical protein